VDASAPRGDSLLIRPETIRKECHLFRYNAEVRAKNRIPTLELTVSTNPQVHAYLQDLVDSGTYGNSEAEAAERLVAREIEQLIKDGQLDRRPKWRAAES
jgi:hypothetical protein